jgi:hypothetical protein
VAASSSHVHAGDELDDRVTPLSGTQLREAATLRFRGDDNNAAQRLTHSSRACGQVETLGRHPAQRVGERLGARQASQAKAAGGAPRKPNALRHGCRPRAPMVRTLRMTPPLSIIITGRQTVTSTAQFRMAVFGPGRSLPGGYGRSSVSPCEVTRDAFATPGRVIPLHTRCRD